MDPDDNTPLKTLCQFYQNSCNFVFDDVTLDVMFKQFKEGEYFLILNRLSKNKKLFIFWPDNSVW